MTTVPNYECSEDHSSSVPLLRAQRYFDDSGARSLDEFSEMEMGRIDRDWRMKSAELRRSLRIPSPDANLLVRAKERFYRIYDSLMGN